MLVSFRSNFHMDIFIELREVLSESCGAGCQVKGPYIPTEVSEGLDLFAGKNRWQQATLLFDIVNIINKVDTQEEQKYSSCCVFSS